MRDCTCPHEVQSLGTLYGIRMGKGTVRTATVPGCPEHDSCHRFTRAVRAEQPPGRRLWCPVHETKDCP